MALIERKTRAENELAARDELIQTSAAEVSELCVALKQTLRDRLKSGMQSHEVLDVLHDVFIDIDGIEAASNAAVRGSK